MGKRSEKSDITATPQNSGEYSSSSSSEISPRKHHISDDITVTVPKNQSLANQMNLEIPKIESLKIQEDKSISPIFKTSQPVGPSTLSSTTKLLDRIVTLRKECLEKMGVVGLSKVYDIIDKFIGNDHLDALEENLRAHLGSSKFDGVGLKIWQLKF